MSSWLAPLGSLQRLSIGNDGAEITVSGSLEALTALQELRLGLWGERLTFDLGARLPESLTRLDLGDCPAEEEEDNGAWPVSGCGVSACIAAVGLHHSSGAGECQL